MARLLFVVLSASLISAIAVIRPTETKASRPTCTMPNGHAFSLGVVATHQSRFYRCLHVFGPKMSDAGTAWVEVEKSAARWVTPRVAE